MASRQLAILAMALMAGFLSVASALPDFEGPDGAALAARRPVAHWLVTHLHPREATTSPRFLILPGFLFAGIALSVYQRVRVRLRQRRAGWLRGMERFRVSREFVIPLAPDEARAATVRALARQGYHVGSEGQERVVAARGDLGFAGSVAFHVGLLLVLVGVGVSVLTRVSAEVVLTEGFPVPIARESFLRVDGRDRFEDVADHSFLIEDFVAEYSSVDTPMDFAMTFSVLQGGQPTTRAVVRVNERLSWRGYNIMLHRYGFAPTLRLVRPDGRTALDAMVTAQLVPPGREETVELDGGERVRFSLFPDFSGFDSEGRPTNRSMAPRHATLFFVWEGAEGQPLAEGRLGRGGRARVNGYAVEFRALAYWGDFMVTRDGGIVFLLLGSLIGCSGLALRVARPDQMARAELSRCDQGTRVRLEASTRYFPHLHERFVDQLIHGLAQTMQEGRT